MRGMTSRLICRLFGHRWSGDLLVQVCMREACRGREDATRWSTHG